MALFDYSLDELRTYDPGVPEPAEFDAFWARTLAETAAFPLDARFESMDAGLATVGVYDVTFNGYGGHPIKGWFLVPRSTDAATGFLPCIVEFIGYGGGRGNPWDWLGFSSAGYAHLVMDTRGQGSSWRKGDTPDPEALGAGPQIPGFMTRGVLDPDTYYYRRVFADGVRAVETARSRTEVDPDRIVLTGASQGGGITVAVGALAKSVAAIMPDVPFLCNFERNTDITDSDPYGEIVRYCKSHRHRIDDVFATLNFFDGIHFARRCETPALFSTALMDMTCPPSGVFAAFNRYAGADKEIKVYKYNEHEGGGSDQFGEKLAFLRRVFAD